MPLNTGGLVSSTAFLLVAFAVIIIFLGHSGIRTWLSEKYDTFRQHMHGPDELYDDEVVSPSKTSEEASSTAASEIDDFDYGIYRQDEDAPTPPPPA